jgi:protein-disulfide isomerase
MYVAATAYAGQGSNSSPAAAVSPAPAQAAIPSDQAQLLKSAEAFVRELFAWGPAMQVKLGPLSQSPAAGFYLVPIQVVLNNQTQTGEVYVSKDGKTLLRGEMYDMSADPFAANRAKLRLEGSPAKGPTNARVTLVEFADFECPHCQVLHQSLKSIETRFPQVRVVYKDFPLNQIHPWAETAAIGGRCAFEQSPAAFWKVHDLIFDNQDLVSAENVWAKLVDYASQAGVNTDAFKTCLSSPDAQKAVDASRAEGVAIGVNSTPTVYVNGRPVPGGDPATIEQYIEFELAAKK